CANRRDAFRADVRRHRVEIVQLALTEDLNAPRFDEGEKAGERETGPLNAAPGDRPGEAGLPRDRAQPQVREQRTSQDLRGQLRCSRAHERASTRLAEGSFQSSRISSAVSARRNCSAIEAVFSRREM